MPKDEPALIARPALQPFTFGGVANFAAARIGRVLLVALLFAALGGAALGRIAAKCWVPVITEAVAGLPQNGGISEGQLHSTESKLLAASSFLAVSMGDASPGNADIGLEFLRDGIELSSLFGDFSLPYPGNLKVPFNRPAAVPIWGAWQAPCVAYVICGGTGLLIFNWAVLALGYAFVPLVLGGLAQREISFWRAWKLCVAAQWPGSLIMSFGLAIYSTGGMSLLFLSVLFLAHFVPTMIYILGSPFFLPRTEAQSRTKANPFQPPKRVSRRGGNPFNKE